MEASLLELKTLFESIHALVGRCGLPESMVKKASLVVLNRANPNKQALINAEKRLEQITHDLGLPMLSDIKNQLNQMQSMQLESVSTASRDAEAIAEVVRNEIRRAMMVKGKSGTTIRDTIDEKIASLERDDCEDDRSRSERAPRSGGDEIGEKKRSQVKKAGGLMMRLGRVRFEDLEEGDALGEGTFGTVMSGTYRGRDVAIKKARGALGSAPIMEAFRQEAEIHYAMRHENIVEVVAFGLGDADNPPCLVMERMQESLYDLLGVEGIEMDPMAKVSIVRDVCKGLRFLHVHGIVHRDLKSLNVLLDSAWTAKISDFGLAKVNSTVAASTGGGGYHSKVGSDFWMAPEVHSNRRATKASDVFSLHVVMWEVFAQQRAGHGKPIGERIQSNPDARLPPLSDLGGSEAVESNIRSMVDRCGYGEPSDRPAMDDVCSVVTRVLKHIANPDENPLEPVAPAPRPQHQAPASSAAATAAKGSSSSTGKDDYLDSHGTQATTMMSGYSSMSSSSSSRPQGRAQPPAPPRPQGLASVGTASRGSRGPPPPLPSRRPSTTSAPAVRQSRSPVPGARIASTRVGSTAKRDDRGVLMTLLYQCSPPPPPGNASLVSGWKVSTGWGGNTSLNRWFGVSTRHEDVKAIGSERVTGLMLPSNGVCGELPEDLMMLDCLALLDLKDNKLIGALSPSVGNLLALQTLDLSGNKLTGAIPSELGDLLSLKSLALHHTGLYGDIPTSLGNLSNLERLDLSSSDVWGNIPQEFSKLTALRVLRLGTNRLSGEIPDGLAKLDKLEELDLGCNKLTGVILVGTWPALRILDFSANELEGWIPPDLMGLESLTTLRLYRNFNLSGGIPPWLGGMITLEEIDLSATQLGGEIPKEIGDLPRLSTLTLGSCKLEGPIPPELGRLRHLKHLALFGNKLTGPIPQTIVQLPALRNLNLERNNLQVTKARIGGTKGAIKQILPKGCNIRL
eukprot:g3744.t1